MIPQHKRVSDPSLTRKKGLFTHSASWIYLALTIIFVAYVFGFISHDLPDRFFQAITDQQGNVMKLYALAVPAGLVVLALATLLIFSRVTGSVADAVHHKRITKGRNNVSVQQFAAECSPYEVSPKVAAQVYQSLRKHYRGEMRIHVEDNLLQDLRLDESAVHDIVGNLLAACNRIKDVRRPYEIATVLDLAMYVDGSPSKSIAQVVNPDPRASRMKPDREPNVAVRAVPAPAPNAANTAAARPNAPAQGAAARPMATPAAKPAVSNHSTGFLAPFRLPEELRAKVPRHISVVMPSLKRKRTPKGSPFTGNETDEES